MSRTKSTRFGAGACLLLIAAAGCEQVKSSTPLSPSIAGPIAGVSIEPPRPLEPIAATQVAVDQQPVTLAVENASSNGVRPLTYNFEIATDAGFTTTVLTQTGVQPGSGGRTSLRLAQALAAERTYYWRVKAEDGANASDYSAAANFRVYTPVVIQAPVLVDPANGATLTTRRPTLVVANAQRTGPAGAIQYLIEVATDAAMANRIISELVPEGSRQSSYALPDDLAYATRYYWHAQALDPGHQSGFSTIGSFVTPLAPVVIVVPPPPPTGGGGGGGPAPNDALDLRTVTLLGSTSIANWAVTSTMTSAAHIGDDLCTEHTKAGRWPTAPFFDTGAPVEGNQWLFALINGRWYGAAGEWLRPGQTCKNVAGHIGQDAFYNNPPLSGWTPAPGELVGVAVSTPARAGQWTTAERSNVVFIRW